MSTVILPFGKDQVAFGLEWRELSTSGKAAVEARQYADELATKRIVIFEDRAGVTVCGLAIDPTLHSQKGSKPSPRSKALSGALLFARTPGIAGHALLVERVGNLCMLVLVRNGLPVAGWDMIGPQNSMLPVARQYLEQLPPADPATIYGSAGEAFADIMPVVAQNFESLVAKIPAKEYGGLRLTSLPISWLRLAIVGSIILVLLVILVSLGSEYLDEMEQSASRDAMQAKQAKEQSGVKERQAAQAAETIKSALKVSAAHHAQAIRDTIWKSVTDRRAGWKLSLIECGAEACMLTWKRDGGTYRDFLEGRDDPAVDIVDSSTVRTRMPIAPADKDVPFVVAELPNQRANLIKAGTLFQRFSNVGATPALSLPTAAAAPAVPPSAKPTDGAVPVPAAPTYLVGTWSLDAKLNLMRPLVQLLPRNFAMDSLTVNPSASNTTFTIKGKFYVRP